MQRQAKTTKKQYEMLLNFIESNKLIISGKIKPHEIKIVNDLWKTFAEEINAIGCGAPKSVDNWRKVFREWKTNVRRKSRTIQIQINGTGGGPPTKIVLTEQEERLLQLISKIHLGDEAVPESLGGSSRNDCDNNLPIILDTEFEASETQNVENSHDFVIIIPDTPVVNNNQYHSQDENDLLFESASTHCSKKRKLEQETSNTPCSLKAGNTTKGDLRYSSTILNSASKSYETAINKLTEVTKCVSDSLQVFTEVYSERTNVLDKRLEAYKERSKILEKKLKMKWIEKFSSLDGFDDL